MKKSNRAPIFLGLISVLIGFVLAMQIQTPNSGQKLYVSAKALSDMEALIQGEKKNQENIKIGITEAEERLKEYKILVENSADASILQSAKDLLSYYEQTSGATEVHGSGIEVLVDDGTRELHEWESENDVLVHDSDILTLLNDLYAAGAEAVSVNGHRMINTSSIVCAGYTVRINHVPEARPFRISAIGDPTRLSEAMLATGSYGNAIKDFVRFQVKVSDDMKIPAYTEGNLTYDFMSITKESETE